MLISKNTLKRRLLALSLLFTYSTSTHAQTGLPFSKIPEILPLTEKQTASESLQLFENKIVKIKYPSNWKRLESQDPSRIIINAPGNSSLEVEFIPKQKRETIKDILFNVQSALDGTAIDTRKRKKIKEWGNLKGVGLKLGGKIMHIEKGQMILFVADHPDKFVFILETHFSSDPESTLAGFATIRQHFVLQPTIGTTDN